MHYLLDIKNSLYKARYLVLLSFLFCMNTESLSAAITINSIYNASKYDLTETTPILWGALSGPDCTITSDGTCNSCDSLTPATDPTDTCSENKVNLSSVLRVCYKHTSKSSANYIMTTTDSTSEISSATGDTSISSGSEGCISIAWSDLCNELESGNTDCTTKISKSIYLVADTDNLGVRDSGEEYKQINIRAHRVPAAKATVTSANCGAGANSPCIASFQLLPGDEKAILDPSYSIESGDFPKHSDHLQITKVRFTFAPGATASAVNLYSENYMDIEVDTDGSLKTNWLRGGLVNDVEYSFRVSVIDEAGNIFNTLDAASTLSSIEQATPQKVFGILEEGKCFIASAAYGSLLDPHLQILRDFRDKILLKFDWGRSFVNFYYKYSPHYASELVGHPRLRVLVQVLLYPLVAVAYILLTKNLGLLLTLFCLGLAGVSSYKRYRQRKSL